MAFADRIEPALEARGIEVLVDRSEIYALEDWWQRLCSLITAADTIVFVVSPDSVTSDVCTKEIAFAAGLGKRFAPIVVRRVDSSIPVELSRLNYIFFDNDQFDENVSRLVEALLTDIQWIRKQTDLTRVASAWTSSGMKRGLLLRPPQLEDAEQWLSSRPRDTPDPPDIVRNLIATSRQQATTRTRRIIGGSLTAAAAAISLALFAWFQRTEALTQKRTVTDRLTRLSVASGTRLLDDGDVPGALLWYANPLALQADDDDVHRIRIAATAELYPRLRQVMPHDIAIQELAVDATSETILTVGADSSIRVWDVRTGTLKFPAITPATKPHGVALAADGKTFAMMVPKPYDDADVREFYKEMLAAAEPEDRKKFEEQARQIAMSEFKEMAEALGPQSDIRLFDTSTGAFVTNVVQRVGDSPEISSCSGGGFVITGTTSIPMGPSDSRTAMWRPGATPAIIELGDERFSQSASNGEGKLMLAAGYPREWKLVSSAGAVIASGRHPASYQGFVSAVALSPKGEQVATADDKGQIVFWNARSGQQEGKPVKQGARVTAMDYSPDGRWLAAVSEGDKPSIQMWDTVTGQSNDIWDAFRPPRLFEAPLGAAGVSVSFSPSGRYLLTTSRLSSRLDGEARIFDVGTGLTVGPKLVSVYDARWTPDGRSIITVSADRTVKVWELFHARPVLSLGQQELLRHGRLSDTGTVLAARVKGRVKALELASFDRRDSTRSLENQTSNRAFGVNDDGSLLIDLMDNQSATVSPGRGEPLALFHYKDSNGWVSMHHVSAVDMHRDRRTVLLAGGDGSSNAELGRILVWDAQTGKPRFGPLKHDRYVTAGSFSSDGQWIISASYDGTARIWSAATGAERHRLKHADGVRHATFDASASRVATASSDGTARIWDAKTGGQIGTGIRHDGPVNFVTFSPDGSLVATIAVSGDGESSIMRVWDATTLQPRGAPMILARTAYTQSVAAFSPDGRFVAASSWLSHIEKGVRVWTVATSEPVTPHLDGGDDSRRNINQHFLPRARSLVPAKDRHGGLILLGIANGGVRQVAPWTFPRDQRPTSDIVVELELMAGRRIDATGALVRLTSNEIADRWRRVTAGPAPATAASRDALAEWHRRESEECEALREWFCAAWHIDRLRTLDAAFVDVVAHGRRGRALAELERWSEAEAEYAAAHAKGARDGETLASLAHLRAAIGRTTDADGLTAALLAQVQGDAEWRGKERLLRAALAGPSTDADRAAIARFAQVEMERSEHTHVRAEAARVLARAFYHSGRLADARTQLEYLEKQNYMDDNDKLLRAVVALRTGDRATAKKFWTIATASTARYRKIRKYEGGNHASSLYWFEWLEMSLLSAEVTRLTNQMGARLN